MEINASRAMILTKSVFNPNQRVLRRLSLEEILCIYDIPRSAYPFFKNKKSLAFVKRPPLKVLAPVGLTVAKALYSQKTSLKLSKKVFQKAGSLIWR